MLGRNTGGSLVLLQGTATMWTGLHSIQVSMNSSMSDCKFYLKAFKKKKSSQDKLLWTTKSYTFSNFNRLCWVVILTFKRQYPSSKNSALWNAMIHPLVKMTIKGAIWYQGEMTSTDQMWNLTSSISRNCKAHLAFRRVEFKLSSGQVQLLFSCYDWWLEDGLSPRIRRKHSCRFPLWICSGLLVLLGFTGLTSRTVFYHNRIKKFERVWDF